MYTQSLEILEDAKRLVEYSVGGLQRSVDALQRYLLRGDGEGVKLALSSVLDALAHEVGYHSTRSERVIKVLSNTLDKYEVKVSNLHSVQRNFHDLDDYTTEYLENGSPGELINMMHVLAKILAGVGLESMADNLVDATYHL